MIENTSLSNKKKLINKKIEQQTVWLNNASDQISFVRFLNSTRF